MLNLGLGNAATVRRARPRDSVARCARCNVVAPAKAILPGDIVIERKPMRKKEGQE